jgi:hypothetical protein
MPKTSLPTLAQTGTGMTMEQLAMKPRPRMPFDDERKQRYLELYRNDPDLGGNRALCAEAVGCSLWIVDNHINKDPIFRQAYQEATRLWVEDNLVKPTIKRLRDGVEKPIIGGKERDQVVATVREYSDSLAALHLKARAPEFRDSNTASGGTGTGGVLVILAPTTTIDDWAERYGKMAAGSQDVEQQPAEPQPKSKSKPQSRRG